MPQALTKRWKVSRKDLVVILCVFAITGFATAYLTKAVVDWAGLTPSTHWSIKLWLRLAVLLFGYQVILLTVAFLLGQFPFFWRFEKKILQRLRLIKKEATKKPTIKDKATI